VTRATVTPERVAKKVTKRVRQGAAYLDEREPGWWQKIDLPSLDLRSSCDCILGQLATDKDSWLRICRDFGLTASRNEDCHRGFNLNASYGVEVDSDGVTWQDLTTEWVQVIEARRAGAS
jgi:hypothetical protein